LNFENQGDFLMTAQKRGKRRQQKKRKSAVKQPHHPGSDYYVQQIIKQLRQISQLSGYGASVIFDDWTQLVLASLEALPNHIKVMANTGCWSQDTPETTEVFTRIRTRYENGHTPTASQRIWECFGQAFALLLEGTGPGLWVFAKDGDPIGPDVLGQIFMEYTNPDPYKGQYFTPWPVVMLMSQLNASSKELVYDRLKQACQHPDNILAHATLLAGLAIEEPELAREWFITRVVPAAIPHFEIIKVCDPCVGSGRMLLGMASQFEPWMVHLGLVQFFGQDIDPLMARLAKINCDLFGLNSYALKLTLAVSEVMETQQTPPYQANSSLPHSPQAVLNRAYQLYQQTSAPPSSTLPTFEELFKTMAEPAPS
jgi:hypothetical protein